MRNWIPAILLLLAATVHAAEPVSPWDTAVRIHTNAGWTTNAKGQKVANGWNGSGTIIKSDGQSSVILTCAHIFEISSLGKQPVKDYTAKITVDLFNGFPEGWPQEMIATTTHDASLIDYDYTRDLGLISIKPGKRLKASQLALDGSKLLVGQRVRVAGCHFGGPASIFDAEIVTPFHVGVFTNPGYQAVVCRRGPATGRSGGGLFNRSDELIGVVGYHSEAFDLGYYAHPESIKVFLIKNKVLAK